MKKTLLLLIIIFILPTLIYAQEDDWYYNSKNLIINIEVYSEAEIFAIVSAFFLASSGIAARIALNKKGTPFAAFLTFTSGTVLIWLLVLILGSELPNKTGALFFILRGIIDPGIVAFIIYIALRKIGVVFVTPIIAAYPLVSTLLSVFFLKEILTLFIAFGTVLILFGVVLLNFRHTQNKVKLKYIILVGISSSLIGLSAFITKFALNISDTPVSGLAFSFTTGIIIQILIITFLKKWKDLQMGWKNAKFFILSGIFVSIGFLFGFLAFSKGDLIVIAPLTSIMPLFTLMLAYIILKKHETITKNIIIGTVLIVIGASIITLI